MRNTGIQVYGADHVVVQNFRTVHSINDGIGTGHCKDVTFRNIDATDNCDQGFSAHGSTVNFIEDCRLERNAGSGICDVQDSQTTFRRCLIAHNTFESGAFFLGEGVHVLEDCAIFDNDDGPQVLAGGDGWTHLRNCLICGKAGNTQPLVDSQGGNVTIDRCTVADGAIGVRMYPRRGELKITNSLLTRCARSLVVVPKGAEGRFTSNYNGWLLGQIQFSDKRYGPPAWSDYQKASRQDARSLTVDPGFAAPPGPDAPVPAVYAAFALPSGSPYLTGGEKGGRMGAVPQQQ